MSHDDGPVLICVRVADLDVPESGSILGRCFECEAPIWISLSGIAFLDRHDGVYVSCVQCALDRPDLDPQRVRMVPGSPRWMRRWLRKYRKGKATVDDLG